jgi:DNA-binding transcriptional LysR family regulator
MIMEFRDLEFFEVIATVGHLGRSAEMLDRTQSALSRCIDRLEKEIGTNLFEPSGRGLRLTSVGEVLLGQAKSIRLTMEENRRQLANHAQGNAGVVKIGSGPTASEYQIPWLLRRLISENENVTILLTVGPSDRLRQMLRESQIDFIVGPISGHDSEEFSTFSLLADEMVVAAGINHPLASKSASLVELSRYRWLLPYRPIVGRVWLDQVFEKNGLQRPIVQIETNSVVSLFPLLSHFPLLTYVSRADLRYGKAKSILAEVSTAELVMKRDLGVVCDRHVSLSALAQNVLAMLREESEQPDEVFDPDPPSSRG